MRINRKYSLQIETNQGGIVTIEPPLTIKFSLTRSTSSSLNTLDLRIYGLSKAIRNQIFQDRINPNIYKGLIFKIGYDKLTTVFRGNIFFAYSEKEGLTDVVTIIQAKDGGFDYVNSLSNRTLKAGINMNDLINDIKKDFKYLKDGTLQIEDKTFPRPVVVEGNSFELVKKYTDGNVFIDLETINILKVNGYIETDIPLLSSKNGLIGTPKRQSSILNVDSLLFPEIIVGQLIEIQSDIQPEYDGTYKVLGFTHSGIISESISGNATSSFELQIGSKSVGGV